MPSQRTPAVHDHLVGYLILFSAAFIRSSFIAVAAFLPDVIGDEALPKHKDEWIWERDDFINVLSVSPMLRDGYGIERKANVFELDRSLIVEHFENVATLDHALESFNGFLRGLQSGSFSNFDSERISNFFSGVRDLLRNELEVRTRFTKGASLIPCSECYNA